MTLKIIIDIFKKQVLREKKYISHVDEKYCNNWALYLALTNK